MGLEKLYMVYIAGAYAATEVFVGIRLERQQDI
jgi:hypothetical protein